MNEVRQAVRKLARRAKWVWVAIAVCGLCGCRAAPDPADAGARASCPALAPSDGDACSDAYLACVYEHCAAEGVVRASCAPRDGGSGSWSVFVTPCGDCGGRTCATGTVCAQRIGGALILDCASHTCGDGPLDCECACGPGVTCTLGGGGDGTVFGCYVGCGAAICP